MCIVYANTLSDVPGNSKSWKQRKSLNTLFQHVILYAAVYLAESYKHYVFQTLLNNVHMCIPGFEYSL